MNGTTQTGRVLKYLKEHGQATNVELNNLRILRYSARIHELRREGHDILTIQESKGKFRYFYRGQVVKETV